MVAPEEVSNVSKHECDVHHILWQRRHYNCGWSKRLREHPYLRLLVPRETLHRKIHEYVGDIPCPPEADCKLAYMSIEAGLISGRLQPDDSLTKRIIELLEIWKDTDTRTYSALERQLEVVVSFS